MCDNWVLRGGVLAPNVSQDYPFEPGSKLKLPLFPYNLIGDGHQPNSRGLSLYTHYKDSY